MTASLDFEREKRKFFAFYDQYKALHEAAGAAFVAEITDLLGEADVCELTRIEWRLKDRQECIRKFQRKYQRELESAEQPYAIRDCLSDLIGVRIVCLYEDQVAVVAEALKKRFRIIEVTDKIAAVEGSEDLLGYKGLHMDLAPDAAMAARPECQAFAGLVFEVQIRSLIQDTWSVLDHKIKYKKAIPGDLKRRINLLSALFELADREFRDIRNATQALLRQAQADAVTDSVVEGDAAGETAATVGGRVINAFSFLRVAGHFFREFDFEDDKVDNFVQDILKLHAGCKRSDLHRSLLENLKEVREYREDYMAENPDGSFSPYTIIRHCLYLYDPQTCGRILSRGPRQRFEAWLGRGAAGEKTV